MVAGRLMKPDVRFITARDASRETLATLRILLNDAYMS